MFLYIFHPDMAFITQLSAEYLDPRKKDDLIDFLEKMPIDYLTKKYTLLEWGKVVGVKLAQEDFKRLGET